MNEDMTPDKWQKIIDDDFKTMVHMINEMKDSLRGEDYLQQIGYYTPLKSVIFDAAMDAAAHKNIRRNEANDILGGMGL